MASSTQRFLACRQASCMRFLRLVSTISALVPHCWQQPFITAATGVNNGQRFPFPFPPHSVSASNPDTSVNWPNFLPLAADPFFNHNNRAAYTGNYMLSIQRQITRDSLLTVSYVGNQGHRILALVSANPGDPALCLSLPGCGPFGEDSPYTNSERTNNTGNPRGQGPDYGENTSDSSVANSNYNALETTLRYQHDGSQFSTELHLCEVDRSGIKSWGTAEPNRPPPEPGYLCMGHEACTSSAVIRWYYQLPRSCLRATASPNNGASPARPASPPAFR